LATGQDAPRCGTDRRSKYRARLKDVDAPKIAGEVWWLIILAPKPRHRVVIGGKIGNGFQPPGHHTRVVSVGPRKGPRVYVAAAKRGFGRVAFGERSSRVAELLHGHVSVRRDVALYVAFEPPRHIELCTPELLVAHVL
jgi:hypothetical protein